MDKIDNNDLEEPSVAKYSYKLYSCKNQMILEDKLKNSLKRGFNNTEGIIKDVEYLRRDMMHRL